MIVNNNLLCLRLSIEKFTLKKHSGMTYINFRLKLILHIHIKSFGANLFFYILNTNHIAHDARVDRINLIENGSLYLRVWTKCASDQSLRFLLRIADIMNTLRSERPTCVLTDRITPHWGI